MRGPRKFCQRGPNLLTVFFFFFLVDEGIEDSNVTINGPSSAFSWQANGGLTLNAG